jgi:DoxX-like family
MTPHTEQNNAMDQPHEPTNERPYSIRTVAFWFCTLIITLELFAGSMWALLRIPFDREQMAHLGYPLYMLNILGVWKLGGGAAILLPRFPRLKEWAYAGALFDFSGAVASHVFVGDGPTSWAYPAILVALTLVSWALRPDGRRLPSASSEGKLTVTAWTVPIGVAAAMLLGALLTLPKGHFDTHCSGPCSDSGLARSR